MAALEADEEDRREMRDLAAVMESLRARGDVHVLRPPPEPGHEQKGRRFGVVVQANELLPRSVVPVAPTSRSARPASFRPESISKERSSASWLNRS